MKPLLRLPLGLAGRVFAILLLAITIEFGVSTYFYERASQLAVRDDEARRLAEHLVIARKLLAEQPAEARAALAEDLTTTRYVVRWEPRITPALRIPQTLDRIHQQVVAWEPELDKVDLRLRLTGVPRNAVVVGGLTLPDGSWMEFATREPVHELSLSFERILWGLAPAVAILLIGGLLLGRTLMPMRRLADAAERMGSDRIVQQVPEGGPGEVRRVIAAFNRMQARIHRLIEERTQALAAVGHDLRTPLARLRLRVDAIPETDMHDAIEADITEMQAMIDSLLAYLGGDDAEASVPVDLAVLCATIADDACDHGRAVVYVGPAHFERRVHPVAIKRALVNLVENGLHHGTHVRITLEEVDGATVVRVEDDGPGIPEAELERVLQPFVRLDHARSRDTVGLGLGLAIVMRAMEQEGGRLLLSNRPEGGLRAEICLPPQIPVLPRSNNS